MEWATSTGRFGPTHLRDHGVRVVGGAQAQLADRQVDGGHPMSEALELRRDEIPAPRPEVRAVDQHQMHVVSSSSTYAGLGRSSGTGSPSPMTRPSICPASP